VYRNLVKHGHVDVVSEICERTNGQTDEQTDRIYTDTLPGAK